MEALWGKQEIKETRRRKVGRKVGGHFTTCGLGKKYLSREVISKNVTKAADGFTRLVEARN